MVMGMRAVAGAVALLAVSGGAWAQDGDPAAGEQNFMQCGACHQVGANAMHLVGPDLNGIVGRVIGSVEGFAYGEATAAMGADGTEWTEELLMEYLVNPTEFIGGSSRMPMMYPDEQFRRDVIAYLAQFDAEGNRAE